MDDPLGQTKCVVQKINSELATACKNSNNENKQTKKNSKDIKWESRGGTKQKLTKQTKNMRKTRPQYTGPDKVGAGWLICICGGCGEIYVWRSGGIHKHNPGRKYLNREKTGYFK